MHSRAVLFTQRIDGTVILLLPSQSVDQDGVAEGHGHHHQGKHGKERHGRFAEASEAGEASVNEVASE